MTSRIQVEVVEADIRWGVRDDSSRCVVARALARAIPDATRIEVDTQTIRCTTGGRRLAYLTPLVVQGYVAAFDAGDQIQPFAFQLRDPMILRRRLIAEESKPRAAAVARDYRKGRRGTVAAVTDAAASGSTPSYAGIKVDTISEAGARKAPPRVFKLKARTYGHRMLRINQPREVRSADDSGS